MKPINIYALTRISDTVRLERLERQMSKRSGFLKIKAWETEGLKSFAELLTDVMDRAAGLDFYYSFTLPKLGKEFDLLRVNDSIVVNIELKSGNVTDDTIKRQLLQNRYYLATLGRSMYFYTFISGTGRLVRLSNAGRLVNAGWEELAAVLEKQGECYEGNIEELFKEDQYLISPLTDPGRFLRQEYFLTAQQNDIENQILKQIKKGRDADGTRIFQGFTGLPGTGKTLLLYDLAMRLSHRERVCIFHPGLFTDELEELNERLRRIDFYCGDIENSEPEYSYAAVMVDEAQRLTGGMLEKVLALAEEWKAPVVFSYDAEEPVALPERKKHGREMIESLPGFVRYKLTNRIRLNKELSAFISGVMYINGKNQRGDYPSVSLAYAGNDEEAGILLQNFTEDGYTHIRGGPLGQSRGPVFSEEDGSCGQSRGPVFSGEEVEPCAGTGEAETTEAENSYLCKEYDKIVMVIDNRFYYDEAGYLRAHSEDPDNTLVTDLFHGLSHAKKEIALVVKDNLELFDRLLGILQKKPVK